VIEAGIYARISDDRTGRAAGVARQQADCTALAESRGWHVAEVYVDNSISAYSGKQRSGYQRLCADIKARRITRVIAWHPDRLHRSPRDLEDFIDLIEAHGVQVVTVQAGDWDLSTPSGRLHARMLGAVARYESEHKSDRVRRALQQNAEAGKPTGGIRRYGYRGVETDPHEADVLRRAGSRLLAGDTLRAICHDLNADGEPTVTGAAWSPSTLRGMLTSPRSAGLRVHRGEVVGPAAWQPIFDTMTWQSIRALLADPSRRTAPSTARVHLLSGLARCAECDAGLLPHQQYRAGGRKVTYYSCRVRGCSKVSLIAARLDAAVTEALLRWLEGHELAPSAEPDDPELSAEVARVEARIAGLDAAFTVDDTMTPERLSSISRGLTVRLHALQTRQADQQRRRALEGWTGDVRTTWAEASLDQRRALLAAVFSHIAVGSAKWGDGERLRLEWRSE
jgi:site-specific DNA recombinase